MKMSVRTRLVYLVFAAAALLLVMPAAAQEGDKLAPPRPPETASILEQYALVYRQEIEAFDFTEINIAYLVDTAAVNDTWIASPTALVDHVSAKIVGSWEALELLLAQAPLDVLIVHDSALDQLDTNWVQSAYRDGTIIVGISTEFEAVAAAINDQCAESGSADVSSHFKEWFFSFAYWVRVDPAEAKPAVDVEILERCGADVEGVLGMAVTHAADVHPITSTTSVGDLADTLRGSLVSRKLEGFSLVSSQSSFPALRPRRAAGREPSAFGPTA